MENAEIVPNSRREHLEKAQESNSKSTSKKRFRSYSDPLILYKRNFELSGRAFRLEGEYSNVNHYNYNLRAADVFTDIGCEWIKEDAVYFSKRVSESCETTSRADSYEQISPKCLIWYFYVSGIFNRGGINNTKCWKCDKLTLCFSQFPSIYDDEEDYSTIPVCMECRLLSSYRYGVNNPDTGNYCRWCVVDGWPPRPIFNYKKIKKLCQERSNGDEGEYAYLLHHEEHMHVLRSDSWLEQLGCSEDCNHLS